MGQVSPATFDVDRRLTRRRSVARPRDRVRRDAWSVAAKADGSFHRPGACVACPSSRPMITPAQARGAVGTTSVGVSGPVWRARPGRGKSDPSRARDRPAGDHDDRVGLRRWPDADAGRLGSKLAAPPSGTPQNRRHAPDHRMQSTATHSAGTQPSHDSRARRDSARMSSRNAISSTRSAAISLLPASSASPCPASRPMKKLASVAVT